MQAIVDIKAKCCPHFKTALLATSHQNLVEYVKSSAFWGVGPEGNGKNMLGRLLVELRAKIETEKTGSTDNSNNTKACLEDSLSTKDNPQSPQPTPQPQKVNGRPQILLLGHSHTSNIGERGICLEADTLKIITYTVDEAFNFVKENDVDQVNIFILHLITNDVRKAEADTVMNKIIALVELIKSKGNNPYTILSLAPNRKDSMALQDKCSQINGRLSRYAQSKEHITVCTHPYLPDTTHPDWTKYFARDGVHLTERGTATLAYSLRKAVESILQIEPKDNTRRSHFSSRRSEHTSSSYQRQPHQSSYPRSNTPRQEAHETSWATHRHNRMRTPGRDRTSSRQDASRDGTNSRHDAYSRRQHKHRPHSRSTNGHHRPTYGYENAKRHPSENYMNNQRHYNQENIEDYSYDPTPYKVADYRHDFALPRLH